MNFTADELNEELSRGYDGWLSIGNHDPDTFDSSFGLVEIVDEGESYRAEYEFDKFLVVKVDGRLFKKSGYYASYDGTHWDGSLVEVEKKLVSREEWVEV